jgi:hypothetical protein
MALTDHFRRIILWRMYRKGGILSRIRNFLAATKTSNTKESDNEFELD